MESIIEVFQYEYAVRALLASAMVGTMCGILGCFIVLKNMSLIGDALSHAILPGVVVGFLVAGYSILGFFTGSVIAGLLAAIMITWIQRNVKTQEDAAIGIVFTSMFAAGVMGISWLSRQEGVHLDLKDFLFGNVLGISNQDLWMTFVVMIFSIVCVVAFYRFFFITTFESVVARTIGISVSTMHYFLMLLLSFAVVASLQSVGVILVVAMLITPASTAYLLTYRLHVMVWLAGLIGLISTTMGLLLAIIFETTPGPAMTITATGFYLLAVFFSPQRGLVSKYFKRERKRFKILQEDVLKQAVRLKEKETLEVDAIANKLETSKFKINRALNTLSRKGFAIHKKGFVSLTEKGIQRGYSLIRAHRLWETYLVKEMGLSEDQIHENAEKYEHILTDALVEEVAVKLGNPLKDPHGSPIPEKIGVAKPKLSSFEQGSKGKISVNQINHLVRSELWELGIKSEMEFEVVEKSEKALVLLIEGKEIVVKNLLSEKIRAENV